MVTLLPQINDQKIEMWILVSRFVQPTRLGVAARRIKKLENHQPGNSPADLGYPRFTSSFLRDVLGKALAVPDDALPALGGSISIFSYIMEF